MIPRGVEVYVATEAVDMRYGFERLGGVVRERMRRELKRDRDRGRRSSSTVQREDRGTNDT